ncbi:MAG: FixH family protein [Alphaproteobacteria bacterium]|nr:FixH family protein [Alphaproteobacteria bacterium]
MTQGHTAQQAMPRPSDKWIPWYFVLFFVVVALLDGIFVSVAMRTYPGTVSEHAYEKGLAYDGTLEEARSQPLIIQSASFKDGVLRWSLADQDGTPLMQADVKAKFVRPVQSGHDFTLALSHKGGGIYEAKPELPLRGVWVAELSGSWDENRQHYQTAYRFLAP